MKKLKLFWKIKAFRIITMLTLISVLSIASVYGVSILYFYGGEVKIVGVHCEVQYSLENDENAEWVNELDNVLVGSTWFTRINITSQGYQGDVEITWILEQKIDGEWIDTEHNFTNIIALSGEANQLIYCSPNGAIEDNLNWGEYTTQEGIYRIKIAIERVD